MRIRRQLTLLIVAVVIPVAVLAGVTATRLWQLQREALAQRNLERVSALRLAIDTDLEAVARQLSAFGSAPDVTAARRLLAAQPAWVAIGGLAADGRTELLVTRTGFESVGPPQRVDRAADARPVSNAAQTPDAWVTYVSVPRAEGGSLFAALSSQGWVDFLRRYPVAEGGTLTLSDRTGIIIARTLNPEQSIGRRSGAAFWERTVGLDEGTFEAPGIEGQGFYSAFSRSRQAGWVLGTGVPKAQVEAELQRSTWNMAAGVLVAALAATLFALWLGSRIVGALTALAASARRVGSTGDGDEAPLRVAEAESVRLALADARRSIAAREAERVAAFERESEARAHAERLNTSKDEFLAMLGHELRNPLSAITTGAMLLESGRADTTAGRRAVETIGRQAGRLGEIVDSILDMARLNAGKVVLERAPVDLAEIAGRALDTYVDGGRCKHLAIERSLEPAWVMGDALRLEQVLSNLLDNACKFTSEGGRVRVSTSADARTASLVVEDDGAGIAPELLPRVFDVFTQGERALDRTAGGLGLGLAVVERVVTLHGGRVTAESQGPGRGAIFRIGFARAHDAEIAAHRHTGFGTSQLPPLDIVAVEDNADVREMMQSLLELDGHRVGTAADGEQGVELIVARRPDVAIVDIGLPGIDGFEVARRVRHAIGDAPTVLVALTGYGMREDRRRAEKAGFDELLVKPFDVALFERRYLELKAARETGLNGASASPSGRG